MLGGNRSQLERGEVDLLSFLFLLNTQHAPFLFFDFFELLTVEEEGENTCRKRHRYPHLACEGTHKCLQETFPGRSPSSLCLLTHIPAWLCHWKSAKAVAATVHLILMRL